MNVAIDDGVDSTLILAAEECPPEKFSEYHRFSSHDELLIRKLSAHGPVLIRGGRGSGKSALLLEAYRRMKLSSGVFPLYVSLRYLPLLQSDGPEYITCFCELLSAAFRRELSDRSITADFRNVDNQADLQEELGKLSQAIEKRIVLLFDDAAHIGREKPLEVFFDLFRTISSNVTSCKASIYPGVTKFGVRFDVYNDSTVIDVSRSDVSKHPHFFLEVFRARYPELYQRNPFSDRLSAESFANIIGRAVVGNMRGFILACNRFEGGGKIGIPEVSECLNFMAADYYWPLMDEVAPKLGVYEPLVEPARELMDAIVDHAVKPVRDRQRNASQDRVLIHRDLISKFNKVFEILEYLGFISRREASRALKSGGRGAVYAINLCNLLDKTPSRRLTNEVMEEWISGSIDLAEIHASSAILSSINNPKLPDEHGLAILEKPLSVLKKSQIYPYGLTEAKVSILVESGISTVGELAVVTDDALLSLDGIGRGTVRRIKETVQQAIWM